MVTVVQGGWAAAAGGWGERGEEKGEKKEKRESVGINRRKRVKRMAVGQMVQVHMHSYIISRMHAWVTAHGHVPATLAITHLSGCWSALGN